MRRGVPEEGRRNNAVCPSYPQKTIRGETPLHWAVLSGKKEMAEFLLAKGAEVNAKTILGQTPLALARTDEMKALLRKYGAK